MKAVKKEKKKKKKKKIAEIHANNIACKEGQVSSKMLPINRGRA